MSHEGSGRVNVVASKNLPLRLLLVLGALTALGPFSFDTYLPALPSLASDFGISSSAAQLTLTGSLLGGALGQLVLGAVSDARGRRSPLLVAMLGFALASAVCALAPNLAVLVLGRAAQGFCGASALVTSRAVVRDLLDGERAAHAYSQLMVVLGLAPIVAPLVGSLVLTVGDWRSVFWFLSALALALFECVRRWLAESLRVEHRLPHQLRPMVASWGHFLREPLFVVGTVTGMMTTSWVVLYLSGSSFALQGGFGLTPQQYAAVFAICAAGITMAGQLNARLIRVIGVVRALRLGFVGSAVAAAPLLLSAATGGTQILPILLGCFIATALFGILTPNAMALAVAHHGARAGSAAGLSGLLQSLAGALVAPIAGAVAGSAPQAFSLLFGGALAASAVIGITMSHRITLD